MRKLLNEVTGTSSWVPVVLIKGLNRSEREREGEPV
jgi:hypothetical protein